MGLLDTLEVHKPQVKRFRGRVGMVFSVGFTKENGDFYGIFMGFHQQKWWFNGMLMGYIGEVGLYKSDVEFMVDIR